MIFENKRKKAIDELHTLFVEASEKRRNASRRLSTADDNFNRELAIRDMEHFSGRAYAYDEAIHIIENM